MSTSELLVREYKMRVYMDRVAASRAYARAYTTVRGNRYNNTSCVRGSVVRVFHGVPTFPLNYQYRATIYFKVRITAGNPI